MLIDDDMVPVRHTDIALGKPLPWAVYDAHRNLLLNKGMIVNSMSQVEALMQRGLFREGRYHSTRTPAEAPEVVADDLQAKGGEYLSLEELKLSPGDSMLLQPLLEGAAVRYSVRIIGYARNKSLLISAPEQDGRLVHVREGQTFQARVFSGLNIGTFTTQVLKHQFTPYPYLHLSYPSRIQAMRLRRSMRAPVSLVTAVYEREGGPQSGSGLIVDISVGGARVDAPQILGGKNQRIFLSFKIRLVELEEYVKTSAIIRTVSDGADEAGKRQYGHGVEFENLAQHDELVIMNLVYRHLYKDAV